MTKAILVIDVGNIDIDIKNTQVTYIELECHNHRAIISLINRWLKPLPHNDFIDEAEGYETEEEYKAYVSGWNDCLDEILGGNDE